MWNADIKDWSKVSQDHAKFIFSQAEKKVDETVKACDSISNRMFGMLTLNSAIWVTLCGFLFSKINSETYSIIHLYIAGVALVYIFCVIIYLFKYLYPKGYYTSGSQPKDLFVQDFFNIDDKDVISMHLYAREAQNYQDRIEHNSILNNERALCLKRTIIADCVLPLILIIISLFG